MCGLATDCWLLGIWTAAALSEMKIAEAVVLGFCESPERVFREAEAAA
jgi:hypothetical protein